MSFDGYLQTVTYSGTVVIFLRWSAFKAIVQSKSLAMQYTQDNTLYNIFAIDGPITYTTTLVYNDSNFPFAQLWPDYPRAQNDVDNTDFQNNWLPTINKRISRTDNFGNPIVTETPYAMSFGLIPGVTAQRAQGYTATSATSGKAIRATTYTPQGTNAQRSVNSTSSSDAGAGTGAQKITINYLDTSFVSHSETVTLNGTTAVNTANSNIAFIENIVVSQVGSGGGNVGTIQIFTLTGGGGTVWGSIAPSDNQTFWAHHYVPTGVTCYILGFTSGSTVVAGQTNINHSGNPLVSSNPQLQIGVTLVHVGAGTWDHDFEIPLAVTGPDLIWLVERPVAITASTAVGGFEYVQF